ncbi:MAG: EamA family transporter [Planctomycetes bacterium]|nr:EamA family transporter [Planctomycetota bacterium]
MGGEVTAPTTTEAPPRDHRRAFLWASGAILLWGTLAAGTGDALQGLRPATLVVWSLGFAAATLLALDLAAAAARRRRGDAAARAWRPWPSRREAAALVALGVWGILGYHALFFAALARAPIVEANLLNYLWPLLMVLLAPWIARETLTGATVTGALVGFAGAALVVTQGEWRPPAAEHALGYVMAGTAALAWSTFSLGLRRAGQAAEGRMTAFVCASFLLSVPLALATDGPAGLAPPGGRALVATVWLGVGPMALAFHCWGRAMALGDAARLGLLTYLDPLLSTLAVAWWLGEALTGASWAGMGLIVVGAAGPAVLRLRQAPPA